MEDVTSLIEDFRYTHLDQVDPNFSLIDDAFYNLKIIAAEWKTYDKTSTGGKKGAFVKFTFGVTDDPKFSGRRVYTTLFPNNFSLKLLRRVQEATGVHQDGDMVPWLESLTKIQPIIKLKVVQVPDVDFKGIPNPNNVNENGTPKPRNEVDWKAGVQPGD